MGVKTGIFGTNLHVARGPARNCKISLVMRNRCCCFHNNNFGRGLRHTCFACEAVNYVGAPLWWECGSVVTARLSCFASLQKRWMDIFST